MMSLYQASDYIVAASAFLSRGCRARLAVFHGRSAAPKMGS